MPAVGARWPAAAPRGTSTRCSRSPTSSARRHPDARLTVLGTAEGLEARLVPEHGLPLAVVPRVPLPRRPDARLVPPAAAPARRGPCRGRRDRRVRRAGRGRLRRLRRDAGVPRGPPPGDPRRHPRAERARRAWPTGSAPGGRARVAVTFPGTRAARARRSPACRCARRSPGWSQQRLDDRAGDARRGRRRARPRPGPARRSWSSGGSLGAVERQHRGRRAPRPTLLARGRPGAAPDGRGQGRRRSAPRWSGVPGAERYQVREYLTEMQLALAVADVVVGRSGAGHGVRARRARHPRRLRPAARRQRRAAAERRGRGRGRRRAPRRRRRPRPRLGAARTCPSCSSATRPRRRASAWAARAASVGVARRRGAASPGWSRRSCPSTGRACGSRRDLGRVHLVGVGGAGMSVVARAARRPRRRRQRLRRRRRTRRCRRCAPRASTVHVGHDAALVDGRRHRRRLVAPSGSPTRSSPRARERGLRVLHRSEALAVAHGRPGRGRGRRRARQDDDVGDDRDRAAATRASTRPSRSAARCSRADGPLGGGRDGAGPAFVAEADESDGSFLAYAPAGRRRDQRRAGPPRPLRLRRGVRGRVRRSSPAASGPAARSSRAPTTPARRGSSTACATRSRRADVTVVTYGTVAGRRRRRGRAARRRRAVGVRAARAGDRDRRRCASRSRARTTR